MAPSWAPFQSPQSRAITRSLDLRYAHTALGQEHEAIEALADCIAYWEKMTPTAQEYDRPSYGKAQFQLGKIYLKKGLSFKARRHLQIAAKIDSQDHNVLYELGQCYLKLDQFNEALSTLLAADQLKPGVDYILDRLAQAHAKKGDYPAAERSYHRIPEQRRRPFVVQHMGMMYLEQGQHERALSYLEVAVSKQPDNHNIHYALGSAQEATGQIRAAHASYARAVSCRKTKYNLDFKEAQEALRRLTETVAALPSPEFVDSSTGNEGVIESYNESRGFGFITSNSQQRIFFHVSAYAGKRKPCQGSRVTFSSETSAKGLRAVQVKLTDEQSTMKRA
jgi:CspA family cold shock protein